MNEARKRDLEERHRLGREEYRRRLEAIKVVTDDIQATRVELARAWVAEHYPDEDITITPSESTIDNIALGFHMDHRYREYRYSIADIARELIAYFDTIGGFNHF